MEKKNTGLIVLIIVLAVAILGLTGYIVYDKVFDKDTTKNENTTTNNTNAEKQENEENKIIKDTKTNSKGDEVTLEYISEEERLFLIINDKKIELFGNFDDLDYYEDFWSTLFNLYDKFIEIKKPHLIEDNMDYYTIYDYNGNKLFDQYNVNKDGEDYLNENGYYLHHSYYVNNYKLTDTKLEYTISYYNDSCQFKNDNCSPYEGNYLSCAELIEFGENIYVTRNYEIEFNGKTFSEPKLVSSIKLKDFDTYKKARENCK